MSCCFYESFYICPSIAWTQNETTTTRSEMIKPWIIGFTPLFATFVNGVLSPIAPSAITNANLLILEIRAAAVFMLFSSKTEGTRISAILLSATNPRNARMNHGNIFAMEKLFEAWAKDVHIVPCYIKKIEWDIF